MLVVMRISINWFDKTRSAKFHFLETHKLRKNKEREPLLLKCQTVFYVLMFCITDIRIQRKVRKIQFDNKPKKILLNMSSCAIPIKICLLNGDEKLVYTLFSRKDSLLMPQPQVFLLSEIFSSVMEFRAK